MKFKDGKVGTFRGGGWALSVVGGWALFSGGRVGTSRGGRVGTFRGERNSQVMSFYICQQSNNVDKEGLVVVVVFEHSSPTNISRIK